MNMNMDLKRKKIKEKYFSTGGMIVISVLGIIGLLIVYFSGIFAIYDLETLYEIVSKNGLVIIFGTFFIGVSLYCWILFFLNIVIRPKNEILYLNKIDKSKATFLNKKGKSFNYSMRKKDLEEKSYYLVLKTHDYIYKVLEKTTDSWIPKEKKSYWLNYYSPLGNFENIFLLPIVYVILLPGLLSFLMSKGFDKIYGAILSIVPLYAIIYDLVYKIKLKKSNGTQIDETYFLKSYEVLKYSIPTIFLCSIIGMFIFFYIKMDSTSRIIFLPFIVCIICVLGAVISMALKNTTLEKIFYKMYIIIFLIFWFGFLSYWIYIAIRQLENYKLAAFTIPFWIVGFFVFYKYIIKDTPL